MRIMKQQPEPKGHISSVCTPSTFHWTWKDWCKIPMLVLVLNVLCCSFCKASDDEKSLRGWTPAAVVNDESVKTFGIDSCFKASPISDAIFSRMQGKSYKKDCTIPRSALRYLHVLHRNVEGRTQLGELVCNADIADDLLEIFRQLYQYGYKIERMVLIDEYDADDERSMAANNTSCFNFRVVSGTKKLSKHAQGLAIDINPLYNPYLHLGTGQVEPANAKAYASNRSKLTNTKVPIIDKQDLCYKLFIQHGYAWGGNWMSVKDYQHFEKSKQILTTIKNKLPFKSKK